MNKIDEYFNKMKNKKINVVGMGVSNIPMIFYYLEKGMTISAHDKRQRCDIGEELCKKIESMGGKLYLGEDYLNYLDGDIIFKSPGMRFDIPEFQKAVERGADLTSEMEVFFDLCPSKNIIAVTGSDGKTTTTTLISKMLKQQGKTVYVGGNIGKPLLNFIEQINESDYIVLELSSFQLHTMKKSPKIAVVTNVAPNHLDMHKSMEEYIDAKKNIFRFQSEKDILILNYDNEITRSFANQAKSRVKYFSYKTKIKNGIYLNKDMITLNKDGVDIEILNKKDIMIPGEHNVENYMAAISVVYDLVSNETINKIAKNFGGVEHRIEYIRTLDGVKYYNSSIDSSPTRTTAALNSFNQKVIVISGGHDKNIPYEPLGDIYIKKAKRVYLIGETKEKIYKAVTSNKSYNKNELPIIICNDMEEALNQAKESASLGDIIILSPACSSFDMFRNFEHRGNLFKKLVNEL